MAPTANGAAGAFAPQFCLPRALEFHLCREERFRPREKHLLTPEAVYCNYGISNPQICHRNMKTSLLVASLLALVYYYYHHDPVIYAPATEKVVAARPINTTIVIARAPSSYDRWKTGPNAQTDLKTGPNAQTDFLPFAPSEQANWNPTPGYTIMSSTRARLR